MPMSIRGLGMATDATQQLAQMVAALSAQKAQSIGGLGDTARQIRQDIDRRGATEALQSQRQQQIDFQQAQAQQAQQQQAQQQAQAEQQRQALAGMVGPQTGMDASGLGNAPLAAMLQNLHAQGLLDKRQGFQGRESELDRGHSSALADKRERGLSERQGAQITFGKESQERRIGANRDTQRREHTFKGQDSALQRLFAGRENAADRTQRADLSGKDRASRESVAKMRLDAAGKSVDPGADTRKARADRVGKLRSAILKLQADIAKPANSMGREKPADPAARAQLQTVLDDARKQLGMLLGDEFTELKKAKQPIPASLRAELKDLLGITVE